MREVSEGFIWARGQVVWDDPANMHTDKGASTINETLHQKLQTLEKELLIESAYFVASDRGVRVARMLHEKEGQDSRVDQLPGF